MPKFDDEYQAQARQNQGTAPLNPYPGLTVTGTGASLTQQEGMRIVTCILLAQAIRIGLEGFPILWGIQVAKAV
ncbi:hypothetical protein NW754_016232 [Fusarium falciforme]|nr:hypothetical protein NW754_016232 [Fusarium falciforme]